MNIIPPMHFILLNHLFGLPPISAHDRLKDRMELRDGRKEELIAKAAAKRDRRRQRNLRIPHGQTA